MQCSIDMVATCGAVVIFVETTPANFYNQPFITMAKRFSFNVSGIEPKIFIATSSNGLLAGRYRKCL